MSRILTHALGTLLAIVSGLGGFLLLGAGSGRLLDSYMLDDLFSGTAATGMGLQAAGITLLVVAVLTGLWTPWGLMCLGALSFVAMIAFSLSPILYFASMYAPAFTVTPIGLVVGGVTQVLGAVIGGTGLAVLSFQARRTRPHGHGDASRPSTPSSQSGAVVAHVLGIVAAPALAVVGLLLVLKGAYITMLATQMGMGIGTGAGVGVQWLRMTIVGFVLIAAACVIVRWSPFALVLPAIGILAPTALSFLPSLGYRSRLDLLVENFGTFLMQGGGAIGIVVLTCSLVAAIHWARNRRTASGPRSHFHPGPGAAHVPEAPPAPGVPPAPATARWYGAPPAPDPTDAGPPPAPDRRR